MKRSRFCAVFLAGILSGLSGCDRGTDSRTICAIPQLASQELYLTERAGMEETAAGRHLYVDWDGPSDSDPQRQIDIVAAATAENRYGIAINPVGSNTTDSAILAALAKGMPVAVLRDPIDLKSQPHLSFLLENYAADAKLIAQRLTQVFGTHGEVAILGVDPYSASGLARLDATEKVLREESPGIRVVDRVIAPYSSGLAQIGAEKALDQHPHLGAFIALNNRAGLGAAAAIATKAPAHPVRVLVFDQSLPLLLRLRRGQIDSIVAQNMRLIGRLAVENIDADRQGKPYEHFRQLEPMLVTGDNIDDEKTQEALLLNWEKP
ncbi:MAG: sugar ABC transporter substrate-binding protein [Acidobacteriota bacterium]